MMVEVGRREERSEGVAVEFELSCLDTDPLGGK
jgi:hypothetical protein